jgi:hypothetical protein
LGSTISSFDPTASDCVGAAVVARSLSGGQRRRTAAKLAARLMRPQAAITNGLRVNPLPATGGELVVAGRAFSLSAAFKPGTGAGVELAGGLGGTSTVMGSLIRDPRRR